MQKINEKTDLPQKRFTRTIEDFTCENCGTEVQGHGYTNHCPVCLWSKHVDVNPGDRLAECKGLMKPMYIESKCGQYVIVHKCQKCEFTRRNKTSPEDSFEAILEVSKQHRSHY
ncbi:MAG: RNHCP domain-containing protein [Acidobacteria bacterium]|nr:RNHCP domain-containing protein [Acidobacteriota bacterium]MCA1639920.1 RNHCP domain-containing protein [Acidobacteriota bacterium]